MPCWQVTLLDGSDHDLRRHCWIAAVDLHLLTQPGDTGQQHLGPAAACLPGLVSDISLIPPCVGKLEDAAEDQPCVMHMLRQCGFTCKGSNLANTGACHHIPICKGFDSLAFL